MNLRTGIAFAIVWLQGQIARFAKDARAVSTVEYALIVVAVVAIVGAAAAMLGGQFDTLFESLGDELANGVNKASDAGDGIS